jgi:diguanylate cyclase (GGDEF)-like protein/PAS domain S-box-containing protein
MQARPPDRRLTLWTALIAFLLIVPIAGATVSAVRDAQAALATAQSERTGIATISLLRRLFNELIAEDTGSAGTRRIADLTQQIDAAERAYPLAGEAWERYAVAAPADRVAAIQKALVHAADRSRLSFDAESATSNLQDAAAIRLPDAIFRIRQLDALVHRLLAAGQATVTDRIAMTEAHAQIDSTLHFGFGDVLIAEDLDPDVRAALDPARAAAQSATDIFGASVSQIARYGGGERESIAVLKSEAHAAIRALQTLHASIEPPLTMLVERRLASLSQRRFIVIIPGLLGIIAVIGLAILGHRNVRNRIELDRVRRESERFAAEARFRIVFDTAAMGIIVVGRDGFVREANPAFHAMLGYPIGSLVGNRMSTHSDTADREMTLARFEELKAGTITQYAYEKRYVRSDGSVLWAEVNVSRFSDDDPAGWFAIGLIENVTERKRIEQKLLYDATHDALTGLANRSLFAARLNDVLARRPDGTAAVIFIDLDHFKVVNDSLGHAAGDRLLCTVAERLQQQVGPNDTVARFGGDEFAVLFAELAHVADLTRRVKLLQEKVAEPLDVEGRSIYTSASIGVAPLTPRYGRAEDLLRDADTAMYRAKAEGRSRAALFDHAMHEGAMRRLQLTSDLRSAVDRDELRLAYQPIVRLADRTVVGYEALMRWEHPRDGLLDPDTFVPLAEETGLIVGMGRWALDAACRRLAELRAGDPMLAMHVNVSVQEIMQSDCAAYIADRLEAHRVPPGSLIVEITENAIIESTRSSDMFLKQLRAIGVGICIDDFGVGYSSLRYLHRFPISGLKIDRSFVTGTDEDLASEPIVNMLLELARTLGLDVVAEGVESERQSAALQVLGCIYGQGFLYARPRVGPPAAPFGQPV